MKRLHIGAWIVGCLCLTSGAISGEFRIVALKGDVTVRRSVQEGWVIVAVGDVLKPDDSIRSGENSSATLTTDGQNEFLLPESAIIDLADLRKLTREEVMLKLAMERVRSVPSRDRKNDLKLPRTTAVHGADQKTRPMPGTSGDNTGALELNGARVLYGLGCYGTSALKAKSVFRIHPTLRKEIESRILVAIALEKIQLAGEALNEYTELVREGLSPEYLAHIEEKISQLRKNSGD